MEKENKWAISISILSFIVSIVSISISSYFSYKQSCFTEKQYKGNYALTRPVLASTLIRADVDREYFKIVFVLKNIGHTTASVDNFTINFPLNNEIIGSLDVSQGEIIIPDDTHEYTILTKRKFKGANGILVDGYSLIMNTIPINIKYHCYHKELIDEQFDESFFFNKIPWTDKSIVGVR